MAYVPPKYTDKNGNVIEGDKAWEKVLNQCSALDILAIPNCPFSGKRIKLVIGKNPPDGDYRKPLNKSEFRLLRKVVPGLTIRVVDSKPELSDPRLEFFLRRYYNMGDSRIKRLTWSNIFDACKDYLANNKSLKKNQSSPTLPNEPITLFQFMKQFCKTQTYALLNSRRKSLQMKFQKGDIKSPPTAKPWKTGQSKYYYTHDLLKYWPDYCKQLPNLPELDSKKIT